MKFNDGDLVVLNEKGRTIQVHEWTNRYWVVVSSLRSCGHEVCHLRAVHGSVASLFMYACELDAASKHANLLHKNGNLIDVDLASEASYNSKEKQ